MSRPARALWIEMSVTCWVVTFVPSSRPARALWIEIGAPSIVGITRMVEAREGLVD